MGKDSNSFGFPVKLFHVIEGITFDLTLMYFDATSFLGTKTVDFKKNCKKPPLAEAISSVIKNICNKTGHQIYPIKALKIGNKIHYFCHINLLNQFSNVLLPESSTSISPRTALIKSLREIRRSKSFDALLDRVRRWRDLHIETSLAYNGSNVSEQFDFEQFLNEYDALTQCKTLKRFEANDFSLACIPPSGDENVDEQTYLLRYSFPTKFPNKVKKYHPSGGEISWTYTPDNNKNDQNSSGDDTDDENKIAIPKNEFIDQYARYTSLKDEYDSLVLDKLSYMFTIKMCEFNMADQAWRREAFINEIVKLKNGVGSDGRNQLTISPELSEEITTRDTEVRKMQIVSKDLLVESQKLCDLQQETERNSIQDKKGYEEVMRSERESFTKKEFNEVVVSIKKYQEQLIVIRKECADLIVEKNIMIKKEEAAFNAKAEKKLELDRLINPPPSPDKDKDPLKIQENIRKSLLNNQVAIRNEHRRSKLNTLDEVDHLRTRALMCCKRDMIAYELSTIEIQEKLGQYMISTSIGNPATSAAVTVEYSKQRKEREERKAILQEKLQVISLEEVKRKERVDKRWSEYEKTKKIFGTVEEVRRECTEEFDEKVEAETELQRAREDFRNYVNGEIISLRDTRNYWLVLLACYARHHKINPQETMLWCYNEFRNPSKMDIPRLRDLGIGDMLADIPSVLSIHKDTVCGVLISEKIPTVRAITSSSGGGGMGSMMMRHAFSDQSIEMSLLNASA